MKRFFVLCLIQVLILSGLVAAEQKPQRAPINPEFVKYMELVREGKARTYTPDGRFLGHIPHPMIFKTEVPAGFHRARSLPPVYDLRTQGTLTSVKDQGDCGSCWSFATYGAIESRWLDAGLGPYDLSENNLIHGHGFFWDPCEGGNAILSTAYLSRRDGPISETDDPYQEGSGGYHPGLTPVAYVTDACFLPNDPDVIKQTVYDYGALYTQMHWDSAYYNQTDFTYYCNLAEAPPEGGHAVTIVGWDDNMVTAGGAGAWIIRNSWGTSFGQDGFFYISYNDTQVNSHVAFWPEAMDYDPNATVHYYDKLGALNSYGWNDDMTDYGLVRFQFSRSEQITKIGTWINTSNSVVSFDIYDHFDGSALSNLLGSINSQACEYAGYHMFNLTAPIQVSTGDDIFVKAKYHTPECGWPIPIEAFVEDSCDPEIETGKCWVSTNGSDGTWVNFGDDTADRKFDLCVKLYGISGSEPNILLEEGFDTSPFPPTGWTTVVTNSNHTWGQGNPENHPFSEIDPSSQASALCPWVAENQDEWLISPTFTISGSPATLEFYAGHSTQWLSYATLKLHISQNGGSTWTQLWEAVNDGGSWGWRQVQVDLSGYANRGDVKLAWQYIGNDGDLVALDGIVVEVETASAEDSPVLSTQLLLAQNCPNPFTSQTTIRFSAPENINGSDVTLSIYNIKGQLVRTLLDRPANSGIQDVLWNARDDNGNLVPAGAYFYQLRVDQRSRTKRMILYK